MQKIIRKSCVEQCFILYSFLNAIQTAALRKKPFVLQQNSLQGSSILS